VELRLPCIKNSELAAAPHVGQFMYVKQITLPLPPLCILWPRFIKIRKLVSVGCTIGNCWSHQLLDLSVRSMHMLAARSLPLLTVAVCQYTILLCACFLSLSAVSKRTTVAKTNSKKAKSCF
jgi:hypothetical protein